MRSRMDDLVVKALEARGFVGFGVAEGGFAYLWANSAIRRLQDLQRERIWVPDGDFVTKLFLETAGVSPIPLAIIDVGTALRTLLINAFGAPPIGAIAMQWHSQVKFLMDVPLAWISMEGDSVKGWWFFAAPGSWSGEPGGCSTKGQAQIVGSGLTQG